MGQANVENIEKGPAGNPDADRRRLTDAASLLRKGSVCVDLLCDDVYQEPVLEDSADPDKRTEELGVSRRLARGDHNHDHTYVNRSETRSDHPADEMPISNVGVVSNESDTDDYQTRTVYWSIDPEARFTGLLQVFAEYSEDAGVTWSSQRLVGVANPWDGYPSETETDDGLRRGHLTYLDQDHDFDPAAATPAMDRYTVVVPGWTSTAGMIPRAKQDGTIDIGWLPSTVATDAEVAAEAAARAAADLLLLPLDGSRDMTGPLDMGSNPINGVDDPSSAQDAATKAYVDTEIAGVAGSMPPTVFVTRATPYTVVAGDKGSCVAMDCSAGTGSITLPTAASFGVGVIYFRRDGVEGFTMNFTIAFGDSLEAVGGGGTSLSGLRETRGLFCDGANTWKLFSQSPAADGLTATPSLRTLGTSSVSAAAGNDARLSDNRTPTDGSVTIAKLSAEVLAQTRLAVSMRL